MKKNWLLLLMTPLFTYANHQYNDLDDDHFYNHGFVFEAENAYFDEYIESELPYFEDYSELFVEEFKDDDQRDEGRYAFHEAILEEKEVVTAPVAAKRGQQKRATAKTQTPANKNRSRDLRQNSNRPRVTHRDKSDSKANVRPKVEEPRQAASKVRSNDQFVFQEQEFDKPSVDTQNNKAAPARQQKEVSTRKNSAQSAKPIKEQGKTPAQKQMVKLATRQKPVKTAISANEQKRPRKVNVQRSAQAVKERRLIQEQAIAQSKSKEQVRVAPISQKKPLAKKTVQAEPVAKQRAIAQSKSKEQVRVAPISQKKQPAKKTVQAEPVVKQKNGDLDNQKQIQQKRASRPPSATARQQRRKATVQSEQNEEKVRQARLQARAKSHHVGKRPIEE